ncbi:MAG: S8 family serine peptidase [Opitutales bacterium]|nr:S8 family serine peptidase [Opitutales bacterium]
MKFSNRLFVRFLLLALVWVPVLVLPVFAEGDGRTVITRLDDLPRLSYPAEDTLEVILSDPEKLSALAGRVGQDLRDRLARFDIRDNQTVRGHFNTLRLIAFLEGDFEATGRYIERVRELEEKPADRLTSGLLATAILAARRDGLDETAFAGVLEELVEDLPWKVVGENMLGLRAGLLTMGEGLYLGALRAQMQPVVDQSGEISLGIAGSLLSIRYILDETLPRRDVILRVLEAFIARHRDEEKPDIWAERAADLEAGSDYTPVIIAVWDSGVDTEVFRARGQLWVNPNEMLDGSDSDGNGWIDDRYGISIDVHARRTYGALLPLTEEELALYPPSISLIKGFTDLRNGVDSEEAVLVQTQMASLEADAFEEFMETLGLFSNYVHGTHVAGIAVEGNPFARILGARLTFEHTLLPSEPTIAEAVRWAQAVRDKVAYFREAGVRVVTMSWGGGQQGYEYALQANGVGDNAEERAAIARVLFNLSYDALVEAMEASPEILFVPAAGNSDSDVGFTRDIPGSISLPNVLAVGAVDQAGDETDFTSYGENVLVHANGFSVESYFPGGQRVAISGTSMAGPQVANLAGKIFAVAPHLTPQEVRDLIVETADLTEDGRRRLIHPARALERARGLR